MLELGDAEEPFRLVGEAWTQMQQKQHKQLHLMMSLRVKLPSSGKRIAMKMYIKFLVLISLDECAVFPYILFPHLRDVDHDITIGHISHPNESLLNDPLALDLDIGHRSPGSQQERRRA